MTKSSNERCGLILDDGTIIEVPNICNEPEHGFEISPTSIFPIEDRIVGTWHTHPDGTTNLSDDDYYGFLNWPDWKHYIISNDEIACYIVQDGAVMKHDG